MKEIDEKVLNKIFINILKSILIIIFSWILNIGYEKMNLQVFTRTIQIFTMIFLFIAIYIIEKAYKKDDGKLAIQGIETIVLSATILTMQYITNRFEFNFRAYSLTIAYIFGIYYVLLSIIEYTKWKKEVVSSYSDIKEIVKKEEPIKKEATKKKKEKVKENIENNEKDKIIEKTNKKRKNKVKKNKKKKKR